MSTTKHTPGPWRRCGGATPYYMAIHSARGYIVFQMADYHHHTEHEKPIAAPEMDEQLANARLIAAGPTMFSYIEKKASEGDEEAKTIIGGINA